MTMKQILPVDSSGSFFWFDIHVIVINIDLRDLHLEMVGQEADGLPNSSQAWATGGLEKACWGPCKVKYRRELSLSAASFQVYSAGTSFWHGGKEP